MEEHTKPLSAPVRPRAGARGGGGRCGWPRNPGPPAPRPAQAIFCRGSRGGGGGREHGDAGGARRVRGLGEPPEDSRAAGA